VIGARRKPRDEPWPTARLGDWNAIPPARGHALRIECEQVAAAFAAYKLAVANSNPPAWCRCRYRGRHELEFWFARAHERTRMAMLVTLHGLGLVLPECVEPRQIKSPPVKTPGSAMTPLPPGRMCTMERPPDARDVPAPSSDTLSRPAEQASLTIEFWHELRPLALLALALLGWGIAFYSLVWSRAVPSPSIRERIEGLEASRQALVAELDTRRQAAGTLAEVQQRIEIATTEAVRTAQQREQARAQLAAILQQLDRAQSNLAETTVEAQKHAKQVSDLQEEYTDTAQRLESTEKTLAETTGMLENAQHQYAETQQQLAKLNDQVAARTNELAEIEKQLHTTRAELADAQAKLAGLQ